MKVDIGLDIGIASVGWAITNRDTLEIVKHGVRLFNTVDHPKDSKLLNETRREKRSLRRQVNRHRTLTRDFIKSLIDLKIITDVEFDRKGEFRYTFLDKYINNPEFARNLTKEIKESGFAKDFDKDLGSSFNIFYLRQKGLKQELSTYEIINVLYWYINHRGYKYTLVDEKQDTKDEDVQFVKGFEYPVDAQIAYFKKNGHVNGTLNRSFSAEQYIKEILAIFSKQKFDKDFEENFLKFFKRQRSFEQGPGNELTFTKYGRYSTADGKFEYKDKVDEKTGEVKKVLKLQYENIWDKTIGHCSVFPNEVRAPKFSLSSEIFNLLNDLNNISFGEEKLTPEWKLELIKLAFETNKSSENSKSSEKLIKAIAKYFGTENIEDIRGFRADKKGAPLLTPLTSLHTIAKSAGWKPHDLFDEIFVGGKFSSDNKIDKIVNILSQTKILESRVEKLKTQFSDFNEEEISGIAKIPKGFSDTHSLSYKAQHEIIKFMLVENKNQMEIIHEQNFASRNEQTSEQTKYLPNKWIDEIIDTPTVKRALRQSIRVLNAIFKLCEKEDLEIVDIVIEMARENNNKAARDNEKDRQNYLEEINKKIDSYIAGKDVSNSIKSKIWLWMQQNGCDAYDGQAIEINELIHNPFKFDIDHIIPYNQVFDNSRTNKVLTKQSLNHAKGDRTPWQYLGEVGFQKMTALWETWYKSSYSINERKSFASSEKFDYLTTKIDFSNPENKIGFIQRNLVDTRYTTRALLAKLQEFKKINNKSWKVKTVNGKMTSFVRSEMENNKNPHLRLKRPDGISSRDENNKKTRIWHGHHAEDAYIVTVLNSFYKDSKAIEKILSNPERKYDKFKEKQVAKDEAYINSNYSDLISSIDKGRDELNNKMDEVRFSRQVIKKQNVQLFNETLYRGKINADSTITKISNLILADLNQKDCEDYFSENGKNISKITMSQHNKPLYEKLCGIYRDNAQSPFPFKEAIIKEGFGRFLPVTYTSPSGKTVTQNIRKITIKQEDKDVDNIIIVNEGSKNASFHESMNWVRIDVYKNKKNKFKLIPINATNAKFVDGEIKINDQAIAKQKEKSLIDLDSPLIDSLYKNEVIQTPDGLMYFVSGHDAQKDRVELKPLWKRNEERIFATINTKITNSKKIYLDELGNITKVANLF